MNTSRFLTVALFVGVLLVILSACGAPPVATSTPATGATSGAPNAGATTAATTGASTAATTSATTAATSGATTAATTGATTQATTSATSGATTGTTTEATTSATTSATSGATSQATTSATTSATSGALSGATPSQTTTAMTGTITSSLTITLTAQNNSGENGAAMLTDLGNGMTRVAVTVGGAPADVAQPMHIHEGTCANLNPKPAFPLNNLVNGTSTTEITTTLSALLSEPYAINGHKSAQEASVYVFCGDIVSMASMTTTTTPESSTAATSMPTTTTVTATTPQATSATTTTVTSATPQATSGATTSTTVTATVAATTTTTAGTTPGAVAGTIDCMGAKQGDTISMLYQWSGQEEARFNEILKPLVDACGIVVKPESTRDQALLDTRVKAGTPPDIAFWNVTQLTQYQNQLIAMDQLGANRSNYAPFFVDPGTIGGKWVGLPVKADIKTIIWYSPAVFEAKGYTVPTTWEELDALVEKMVANGDVPWSMGFESGDATGWTGSDFIQDILLVQQGPQYVMNIISGTVPYSDTGVAQAYQTYGKWAKDPKYTVGGAQGTLSTAFLEAIYKPFADPPEAMMVKQSGFAGGEIAKKFPDLQYGTDYDFFAVPGAKGLQGGADWMMAFKDTPAVRALVTYLSSELGGANWAKAGFDLSPNKGAYGQYSDPALVKKGAALANTQGFTPDIGDSIPGGFGKAEWTAIINYVNGQDLQTQLNNAAKAQSDALKQP